MSSNSVAQSRAYRLASDRKNPCNQSAYRLGCSYMGESTDWGIVEALRAGVDTLYTKHQLSTDELAIMLSALIPDTIKGNAYKKAIERVYTKQVQA